MNLVIRLEPIDEGHGHVSFVAVAVLLWLCYFIVASSSISGYASDAEVERRTTTSTSEVRATRIAHPIPGRLVVHGQDQREGPHSHIVSSHLQYVAV